MLSSVWMRRAVHALRRKSSERIPRGLSLSRVKSSKVIDWMEGHGAPPIWALKKSAPLNRARDKNVAWDSFNPTSADRCSQAKTRHSRAAYYVAASPEGTLLKAIVRDRDPLPTGGHPHSPSDPSALSAGAPRNP